MIKWLLIVLVFESGQVVDSKIGGAKTEAECRKVEKEVVEFVKQQGGEPWTTCVPMTYVYKPTLKKDRDS